MSLGTQGSNNSFCWNKQAETSRAIPEDISSQKGHQHWLPESTTLLSKAANFFMSDPQIQIHQNYQDIVSTSFYLGNKSDASLSYYFLTTEEYVDILTGYEPGNARKQQ